MAPQKWEQARESADARFEGKQLFVLFFGGTVVACLVFALGVMVGRKLESRRIRTSTIAATANAPLTSMDALSASDEADSNAIPTDFALQNVQPGDTAPIDLLAEKSNPQKNAATPPPASPTKSAANAPIQNDKAAAPSADIAKAVAVAKTPNSAQATPEIKTAAAPPAVKVAAKTVATATAPTNSPFGKGVSIKSTTPAAPTAKATPAISTSTNGAPEGRFTLKLPTFATREEADKAVKKYATGSLIPRVDAITDNAKGGTVYRVLLGVFASRADAMAAKDNFEKKNRLIAYVTRAP